MADVLQKLKRRLREDHWREQMGLPPNLMGRLRSRAQIRLLM
jgi:hypothetical protein